MSEAPRVTVNILAHNRRHALARSMRIMHDQLAYPRDRLEFIVVDNSSDDGTAEMLRSQFPGVRVIENENVGAAGWTRGFEEGRGDYFLILDDDCYLAGDALERAVAAAQQHQADLVSFRVLSSEDSGYEFTTGYRVGLLSFWACAALISRSAIEALGGFDPKIFIWGNELEFTIRLLDRGLRHLFLPEVSAIHMKPPPGEVAPRVYTIHLRHVAYIVAKLLQPRDAVAVLANLGTKALLGMLRRPSRWTTIPALVLGAVQGGRHREPVRAPVSSLYRVHFREFSSPRFYLGQPLLACRRTRQLGGVHAYLQARHDDYYASRPELYPTRSSASLQIDAGPRLFTDAARPAEREAV